MTTLGIDLSSMPANTAAAVITWKEGQAVANPPHLNCTDSQLASLIEVANAIGIDAPFGWPGEFAAAVALWPFEIWNEELRDRLRFRETDRFVRTKQDSRSPLSVSTDLISLPAMRAMALLKRFGVTDRSGDGRFFEVYPAASLRAWRISDTGYKGSKDACSVKRVRILDELRVAMPWLSVPDSYGENSDALDSLVASLTARMAAQGKTYRPDAGVLDAAQREGWIHIPIGLPGA